MTLILYVDDEETIGQLVHRFFDRRGDQVLLAQSLTEARELLLTNTPDVIFLDLTLGAESGFELMAWIHEELPEIADRVTFVTGDSSEINDNRNLWEMLGHQFLRKPFRLAALATFADDARSRASA